MDKKGMLIIISGPSGSGKGTIVKSLDPKTFSLSVSMTTRGKREGEVHGKDYFFVTKEEFVEIRDNDGFIEHVEFCGNMYGTPKSYVLEQINNGSIVILEIDVLGALQIKEIFQEAITIFISPPSMTELKNRLIGRNTEDMETIERRLRRAKDEFVVAPKYDFFIVNNVVEQSKLEIESIVRTEYLKPERNLQTIKRLEEECSVC